MKQSARYSIVLLWIGIVSLTNTYAAQPAPSFAALVRWKAAVISPRSSALKELYSTDPAPRITVVGKTSADISNVGIKFFGFVYSFVPIACVGTHRPISVSFD